eukprot:8327584-Alexandrium_andersonii.AAC.1
MLVKSVQLGSSRCAGRATIAEMPLGQGRSPSREAHWAPLRAAPKRAPCYGRGRSDFAAPKVGV